MDRRLFDIHVHSISPSCLDGILKMVILLCLLILILCFIVNFDKVTERSNDPNVSQMGIVFVIATASATTRVRTPANFSATCQTASELSEAKMPPPLCLDGASKIIILLLLLLLLLPFLVNFDNVTHFKRPTIQRSEEHISAKMTPMTNVKSWESKNGDQEKKMRRDNDDFKEKTCFSPPLSDHPIPSLAAVASLPPPSPPNSSCKAPTLPLSPSCKDPAFTGKQLPRKRKIVHMILFGFEVDTPIHIAVALGGHIGDPPKGDL